MASVPTFPRCRHSSPSGPTCHYSVLEPGKRHFTRWQAQLSLCDDHSAPFSAPANSRLPSASWISTWLPPWSLRRSLQHQCSTLGPDNPQSCDFAHPFPSDKGPRYPSFGGVPGFERQAEFCRQPSDRRHQRRRFASFPLPPFFPV
jgi:hypothetical protein